MLQCGHDPGGLARDVAEENQRPMRSLPLPQVPVAVETTP